MIYDKDELQLFDSVLQFLFNYHVLRTEKKTPNPNLFSKAFNIDRDRAQHILNEVIKNGTQLGFLDSEKLGYGNYEIVRMHKIPAENFINQGGFLRHFERIDLLQREKSALSSESALDGNWLNQVASNQWIITIVGGVIVSLIVYWLLP